MSNEIVHEVDTFTTLARLAGAEMPKDRMIDGVDQTDFFLGKQEKSNREGFPCYVNDTLYAVKWRNWKAALHLAGIHLRRRRSTCPIRVYSQPDSSIRASATMLQLDQHAGSTRPMLKIADDFQASLKKEPPIPPGTLDPYRPPRGN